MKTKYITYEQYIRQANKIKELNKKGVEFIYTKSKTKIILGSVCIAIALFPNGLGIVFYPLGFSLLASGGIDFLALAKEKQRQIKVKWWALCKRLKC